jgi:hypothetical protein
MRYEGRRLVAGGLLLLLSVTASNAACRWAPDNDSPVLRERLGRLIRNLTKLGAPAEEAMYVAEHLAAVTLETSSMDADSRQRLREGYVSAVRNMTQAGAPLIEAVNLAFQAYRFAKATTPPCAR